jgi:oxygen-independent coproporphyrinogen-3 oxidase
MATAPVDIGLTSSLERQQARLEARVPRYTSYPTAPHFHGGVGPIEYANWLRQVPDGASISLYIHIPFCDSLCWFCGCQTTVVNRYGPITAYLHALAREIVMVGDLLGNRHHVSHMHWGGGSPTILLPADLWALSSALKDSFGWARSAEFAVEIDPRGLTDTAIATLAEAGVNRVSLGLQDFNPKVQQAINRIQSEEETASAVNRVRAAGIGAVNLDLMYGLPHQGVDELLHTVETALELDPDRIALFGYAHVPQMRRHQQLIPEAALPGAAERLAQADEAEARLVAAGYVRVGIDHFAKPTDPMAQALHGGDLKRNFQGYTTDDCPVLIGLGASAIGTLPQGYVQNATDTKAYMEAVRAGGLATARGVALSAEDRLRRSVINRLMCDLEVDLDAEARQEGLSPELFETTLAKLAPEFEDGIVSRDGWHLHVPDHSRRVVRVVAAAFDDYLGQAPARHSVAV